jgi:UDP-glucose 4-epimerase
MILATSLEEPMGPAPGPVASPYAAAKWCSSLYAAMFHDLFRAPVALVRPYMTYGPRQRPFKVLPSVILSLLEGRAPDLGPGTRPVDWIYVGDVIEGMLAAAERPGIEGRTLDLGTGVAVTIREVVETIVRLMGVPIRPIFGALPERPKEVVRVADVAVTEAILGWKARTPLEDGLRRTIAWYRSGRSD